MKRTNLVLDEEMLEKATRLMGAKTYSEAVNRALEESIKLIHIRGLADLMGKNPWAGSLSEMREDRTSKATRKKGR
jgi:Arc/MetJ family transcription regulator